MEKYSNKFKEYDLLNEDTNQNTDQNVDSYQIQQHNEQIDDSTSFQTPIKNTDKC